MKKVNIIYDDVMDDVDIIVVSNDIYQNIEKLVNIFMKWLVESAPKDDQDYWVELDGKLCSNLETVGFVKWLNSFYCKEDNKVSIVKQHTNYCPKFKKIEF